jgi:hypothetical protein
MVGAVIATVVDTEALIDTVLAAVVSGLGITLVFSLAIFGVSRFAELGRERRTSAAVAYGALAVLAGLAFAAAITVGIIVMTQK